MKKLNELWTKRLNLLVKEVGKYGRLIFNDHFSVILFVILGFFMFFYREQLMALNGYQSSFIKLPILFLSALILGVFSTYGRPIWLMKAADRSYLFPKGGEWRRYWLNGSLLGLIIPMVLNAIIAGIVFPFVAKGLNWQGSSLYLWILMQLLAVTLFQLQFFARIFDVGTLGRLPFLFLYSSLMVSFLMIFSREGLMVMIALLVASILACCYFCYRNRQQWLNFEYTVEEDLTRTHLFYKWVGFFAEVPQTPVVVKRRAYLDWLITLLTRKTQNRDYYLFVRLLFRNNAFSGIWLRVLLFISILLLLTDNIYLVVGLGSIGFYLTIVQILPMIHYYESNPFQKIYPKKRANSASALQRVSVIILIIQWLTFCIAAVLTMGLSLATLNVVIMWLLVMMLLVYLYIPFWLHKQA